MSWKYSIVVLLTPFIDPPTLTFTNMVKFPKKLTVALPEPKDLSHHYSEVTKSRQPSAIKEYYKFFKIPNIGNLAGGKDPHPAPKS